MRLSVLMCVVLAVAVVGTAICAQPVFAETLCSCGCCDAGVCLNPYNSTQVVEGGCGACTKDYCAQTYTECQDAIDDDTDDYTVVASCIYRNTATKKVVIIGYLVGLAVLCGLGWLSNYFPALHSIVTKRRDGNRHYG
jgi:hypothetical protein